MAHWLSVAEMAIFCVQYDTDLAFLNCDFIFEDQQLTWFCV